MHVFGDIFRYKERNYVLLAKKEELTHAAQILNISETEQIKQLDDQRADRPDRVGWNKLFYYVILTTPNFTNRCAHLNTPDDDSEIDREYEWLNITLNETDRKALKMEILKEGIPVSGSLKKIVEQLDI